ncbi:MAG: hypothetical protein WBL74_09580 [Novosphingobium sp.]|uniref:hypothetical protein n=1 Tax=Novosphingobium sp. TaxID=1874826 RepID=UPI003C7D4C65
MREFLLNRTNWVILTIWAMAAASFNLWQLASGGHTSGLATVFALIPTLLIGLRSFLVLKQIYRF